MKTINNFESVQASSGEYAKPEAGGYIVKILDVNDVPIDPATGKGDYLKIDYDIAEGEFSGYYKEQNNRWGGDWYANFIRSYKEKVLGMFKHFINCVEQSNNGFAWDWNEKELIGKKIGVVLQEEEYRKNDGTIGSRLRVNSVKTVRQIESGDFKIPPTKKVEDFGQTTVANSATTFEVIADDDLPF